MSETPRTNEQAIRIMFGTLDTVVPAEFSRQLETELAEARAEIERLKSEHEDSLRRAKDNAVSLSGTVTGYAGELLAKDKLIEQMREALKKCRDVFLQYAKTHHAKIPEFRPAIFPDPFVEIELS